MIQCRFKNAEHCVVNTFDFKNFTFDSISHAEPIDLRCWKFRLNKLVELLGVTMDEHFSWIEHVKALLSSCYGVLSVLSKLRKQFPRSETARRKPDLIEIGLFVCCVSPTTTIPTEATTESPKRMRKFRIMTLRKRSRFPTIGLAPSS
jgi:hypothetical protein